MSTVGYGNPPMGSRFGKGRSGNPNGRPRGSRAEPPFPYLGQMVTIAINGTEQKLSREEAFIRLMVKQSLEGKTAAKRTIAKAREIGLGLETGIHHMPMTVAIIGLERGCLNENLVRLRMARKIDRFSDRARLLIEPWIVQEALKRLEPNTLSEKQQETVVKATRTPRRVVWPDWWTVRP